MFKCNDNAYQVLDVLFPASIQMRLIKALNMYISCVDIGSYK